MRSAALLGLICMASALTAQTPPAQDPAASVNPFIGTGFGPGDGIDLFPGATTPFGRQLSPDTEDRGYGYHYDQYQIRGFSMTHMSGPGCPNEGDVFFTATTGPVLTQMEDIESPFSHTTETATPGYYQVRLLGWNIDAQLSATDHTGIARFTFPAGQPANILVPISHTLNSTAAPIHVVGDRQIEGYVENHAFCNMKPTYKVYFVMIFSQPFTSYGTWTGDNYDGFGKVVEGSREAAQTGHQEWVGAYASWPASRASTRSPRRSASRMSTSPAQKGIYKPSRKTKTSQPFAKRQRQRGTRNWASSRFKAARPPSAAFFIPRSITACSCPASSAMSTGATWASTIRFTRCRRTSPLRKLLRLGYLPQRNPAARDDRANPHGRHGAIRRTDVPAGWMDRSLAADQYLYQRDGRQPALSRAGHGMARRLARLRYGYGLGRHAERRHAGASSQPSVSRRERNRLDQSCPLRSGRQSRLRFGL